MCNFDSIWVDFLFNMSLNFDSVGFDTTIFLSNFRCILENNCSILNRNSFFFNCNKYNTYMRESDKERERGDRSRFYHGQLHRHSNLLEERSIWGGGEGVDWLDSKPWRRKALRQVDQGQDRQRENKRLRDWEDRGYQHPRFRFEDDSRELLFDRDVRYYSPDRYYDQYDDELVGIVRRFPNNNRNGGNMRHDDGGDRRDVCREEVCERGVVGSRRNKDADCNHQS